MRQEYRKNPRRLSLNGTSGFSGLSYISCGIFDRGLNGYLNYCRYDVTGRAAALSGSKNDTRTLRVDAANEEAALAAARSSGLVEPFEIVPRPHNMPSAMQREYARDLGITLPEDVCGEDAACLIARTVEDDPQVPSVGLALYADRHGVRFSAWTGQKAFMNLLWRSISVYDRLCLFVYFVDCYLNGRPCEDPDDHESAEYARFADEYIEHAEVVRTIERIEGESLLGFDAYSAKTNTAAFTAAVGFLRGYRLS